MTSGALAVTPGVPEHGTSGGWLLLGSERLAGALRASLAGVRLRGATAATEFADLLHREQPRLAILCFPPAGAGELQAALAERARRPDLAVVVLNRSSDVEERLRMLDMPVDDALPVDLDPEELAARLRRLSLGEPGNLPVAGRVDLGGGRLLDLSTHELIREGRAIHLRPKEVRLLQVLASRVGQTVTRRELLDEVWGRGRDGDPRTVDVHVRWLRAKLEDVPHRPVLLRTVHGLGYRLASQTAPAIGDPGVNEALTRG